ncbi:MAG: thioredoxin domain-containing protein [Chloroflexi bacterium]|nr:thioredoxin domain-containing protein [Chloroflexota bacterium]
MAYVASSSPNLQAMKTAQAGALSVPALVMFYSDDCHSCRVDRPLVSQLDQQFDGRVKFIYLDVGLPESQPYLAQFDVRGLPTIALLDRGGKVVINFAGWPGDAAIRTEIEQLLAQP